MGDDLESLIGKTIKNAALTATVATTLAVGIPPYETVHGLRGSAPFTTVASKLSYGMGMASIAAAGYAHARGYLEMLPQTGMLGRAAMGAGAGLVIGYLYGKAKERWFGEYGWLGDGQSYLAPVSAAAGALYATIGGLVSHIAISLR